MRCLRGGWRRTLAPLPGRRLATPRGLVPPLGLFGFAGRGRIIRGRPQVRQVNPPPVQTPPLVHPAPSTSRKLLTAFEATQIETYVRQDDADTHAFTALTRSPVDPATGELTAAGAEPGADDSDRSMLMMYRIETFPAGTRFATWIRLAHATDLEAAFFADVLDTFRATARLGGRAAIGHGTIHLDLDPTPADDPRDRIDWRAHLVEHRAEALTALEALS